MKATNRRTFLTIAGGSALLAYWMRGSIARAEGEGTPKRLVILHRPNGSIAEDWLRGSERGPILEPFAPLWSYAVALRGVNVRPSNGSTGGSHEAGLVTLMTGAPLGATIKTSDDYRSTAKSLDQRLLESSPILKSAHIPSLQLAAHGAQDGGNEVPNTALSYRGPADPMYPELNPQKAYERLFSSMLPGGATDALTKARARRKSVLDFVKGDLARVRSQFPATMKEDLDTHEEAVRELERSLDGMTAPTCKVPTGVDPVTAGGDYLNTAKVGAEHLRLIVAAFACDLTRVATFMWATGASLLDFGALGTRNHHSTSHANERKVLSAVDRWYSERTAAFIQLLVDTPDLGGGKLIDNTLVWYVNEVAEGWNHSFDDYPFLLFGGDGVNLKNRGRVVDAGGKSSNDVWTSLAPSFGATLTSFGTKASGAIGGLFG